MINNINFSDSFFKNAIDTFEKASDCMVSYNDNVIDFDKVKIAYCEKYGSSQEASQSVDVLVHNKNNNIVFIEFKNGKLNGKYKKSRLKSKLRDSILIFNEINRLDLSFTRKNMEYILVYNYEKNKNSVEEQQKSANEGLRTIQQTLAKKARQEFVYFGLELLKNVFVLDVHTYTKEEFDKYYNTQLK